MDDLKLYVKPYIEIQSLTNTVTTFSTSIAWKLSWRKCAVVATKWGKIRNSNGIEMLNGQTIRNHQDKASKYLDNYLQLDKVNYGQVQYVLNKEYIQIYDKIAKAKLNGENTIKAITIYKNY